MEIKNNISPLQNISLVNKDCSLLTKEQSRDYDTPSTLENNKTKMELHPETNDIVYKTYKNKELLFQFPTSDILKLRAYVKKLSK